MATTVLNDMDLEENGRVVRDRDGAVMVCIPAGEFIKGVRDYRLCELDQILYLDEYFIDQYPISASQFADFLNRAPFPVDERGCVSPHIAGVQVYHIWPPRPMEVPLVKPGLGNIERLEGWWQPFPHHENRAALVTWYGARLYAKWVSGDLPTEAQWEKAGRGPEGRLYPWGNKLGDGENLLDESSFINDYPLNDLPEIGQYPFDVSSYGVHDLWGRPPEWCRDGWPYSFNPVDVSVGNDGITKGGLLRREATLSSSCSEGKYGTAGYDGIGVKKYYRLPGFRVAMTVGKDPWGQMVSSKKSPDPR